MKFSSKNKYIFFTFFLIFTFSTFKTFSQSEKSTILQKDTITPLQKLLSDTIQKTPSELIEKPGGAPFEKFTAEQDSAYIRAMRLKISTRAKFLHDLKMLSSGFKMPSSTEDLWASAQRNVQIPAEYLKPSPVEMTLHQYNIRKALSVPYLNTMPPYGTTGVPISTIKKLFGLEEDVSPEIKYSIETTSEVEIVIYSIQAVVIATIFKGYQTPGNYIFTWNGRDDNGKLMPPGDYIAEVRIGNSKYIRKRIVIN